MTKNQKHLKDKINLLDKRSLEVQEILGTPPKWIIRWGITVVFVIVALIITGSSFIAYNDIIPAKIVVTSKNPPIYLKAKSTGRLTNIFVEANEFVEHGQILAEIENTATLDDVLFLKEKLSNFDSKVTDLNTLSKNFPPYLNLGRIQNSYAEFLMNYQNFILFNTLSPTSKEAAIINKQLIQQKQFLNKQQNQLQILKQDLELAKKNHDRNLELFQKQVISEAEYENISRGYLADKQNYESFLTSISNTQIAIANFENLLTKTNIQGTEFKNGYTQQIDQAYQNLNNEILLWEQQFILKTPIDGRVTLFDIWNKFQNVDVGTTLFTIVPEELEEIIGKVTLPIRNSGKVKVGQKVIIKLDNYPFEEWGSLTGEIANISEVPKQGEESFYTVYIKIEELMTTYNKEIEFKQEMMGNAQIIVEELTILQRIFYQLRKLIETK